jgi:hypothetical protein
MLSPPYRAYVCGNARSCLIFSRNSHHTSFRDLRKTKGAELLPATPLTPLRLGGFGYLYFRRTFSPYHGRRKG